MILASSVDALPTLQRKPFALWRHRLSVHELPHAAPLWRTHDGAHIPDQWCAGTHVLHGIDDFISCALVPGKLDSW
jgi:hypothetical protein